ncbi:GIY-YIG nuclease family protein [Brucella anthropi]|uniref:GIY-YIG nuclease family protein n=1 Tax=Brucella anthropi TaxID=529 RepID=UPI001F1E4970|nr:GIY-YIG nuclease family protein [Brucella anthropi]
MYAFVKAGVALYVGVATVGLAKRLYFYGRPGITQRTSQRLNAAIKTKLAGVDPIEIYVALPSDLEWNGLPVHGSAGLELGLIKKFALSWNMRSANA